MPGSTARLIALILPLGLDTLGVAVALGIAGLPARRRSQLALLFAAFEAAMPLIGAALGKPLGEAVGTAADYLAAGVLGGLGAYLLVAEGDSSEQTRLSAGGRLRLGGALALGVSVSLDELAIGIGAGLLRLPLLPLVIATGVQAFVVTQLGMYAGSRIGRRLGDAAEALAGLALIALAAVLVIEQLAR